MKKFIIGLTLMLISSVSYAKAYECKGYVDGVQIAKTMKVNASKTAVAETKAKARMKKAKIAVDYVTCT